MVSISAPSETPRQLHSVRPSWRCLPRSFPPAKAAQPPRRQPHTVTLALKYVQAGHRLTRRCIKWCALLRGSPRPAKASTLRPVKIGSPPRERCLWGRWAQLKGSAATKRSPHFVHWIYGCQERGLPGLLLRRYVEVALESRRQA